MTLNSIIFDLDGTLLNTLDDLTAAVNHAFKVFGLGEVSLDRVRRYVGNGVPKLVERAIYYISTGVEPNLEGDNKVDKGLFNACLAEFTAYYDKHNDDFTAPYDGVPEMLAEVKKRGLKYAIVTNKYDAAAKSLCAAYFPHADAVVGASDGIRPKPSPDGVLKALEILGSDTARSVYVGDGETDMKTAKACGMPAVGVTWGFRDRQVLESFCPACIIDSPSELLDALDKI